MVGFPVGGSTTVTGGAVSASLVGRGFDCTALLSDTRSRLQPGPPPSALRARGKRVREESKQLRQGERPPRTREKVRPRGAERGEFRAPSAHAGKGVRRRLPRPDIVSSLSIPASFPTTTRQVFPERTAL